MFGNIGGVKNGKSRICFGYWLRGRDFRPWENVTGGEAFSI